ncbi:TlpA family protein disulfide reductase [Planctobacterium marinum]|uniref:TlpA family protein disulfide reductase n=1 Tax=Planctobacterium marinum TaxID=1631968 RepID=UPI001E3A6735|nr:TlpA disulfide reductase family protein [Planctobacterium marinum]MCC2604162.1 TlpA family protein disulfide reductase [Planctobacterium marinum]
MRKNIIFFLIGLVSLSAGIVAFKHNQADFVTIDQQAYRWGELRGQWVVVNYFAEWCAPCLKEVPELNKFHNTSGYPLFAISFDNETDEHMQQLRNKYDMRFPVISTAIPAKLPMEPPKALPATYIIDDHGVVRQRLMGEQSSDNIIKAITRLKGL